MSAMTSPNASMSIPVPTVNATETRPFRSPSEATTGIEPV